MTSILVPFTSESPLDVSKKVDPPINLDMQGLFVQIGFLLSIKTNQLIGGFFIFG